MQVRSYRLILNKAQIQFVVGESRDDGSNGFALGQPGQAAENSTASKPTGGDARAAPGDAAWHRTRCEIKANRYKSCRRIAT
jgi:hypothetical protein